MIDTKILVEDTLLRELSLETRKIGSKVVVKHTPDHPEYMADIMDVIILPHSDFYRTKFMVYYKTCNNNSVKALKELNNHFPFISDFELGIGYILNIAPILENIDGFGHIKIKTELEVFNTFSIAGESIIKNAVE